MRRDSRPMVEIENLSFGYTDRPVLDINSLCVERAAISAVIGPNGCGKTTLFKVINGLVGPFVGEVLFDEQDITTPAGRRQMRNRSIYVHQHPYIFRDRVWENVAYGLKVRGIARTQRRALIAESLRTVGLEELAHRPGHALSGGESQRLAIARGLALRPDLLLLDEPTSNIDPESVRLIENAVVTAARRGTTILLSTHNLATAYRIATAIFAMEEGRMEIDSHNVYHGSIVEQGESHALFDIGPATIAVPSQDGTFSAAVVPMDDIILSINAIASSAQNQFQGTVVEVVPDKELHKVKIDCGFVLTALVTKAAVERLNIAPGAGINASFKASAVRLY